VSALLVLPSLKTKCGPGSGLAVCPALSLLATSCKSDNTIDFFSLPDASSGVLGRIRQSFFGAGLVRVCTLGGPSSALFRFSGGGGWLAFMGPSTAPLLLATDAGHDAVHVIDVAGRVHAGYVAAPGTIAGPRGVAARGSLVAVSAWKRFDSGDHVVCLFQGSGTSWSLVYVMGGGLGGPGRADGQLSQPFGLRFTGDGTGFVVADEGNNRASQFRVEDGAFVRHVASGLMHPLDVEECKGGWLVACSFSHTVEFVGTGGVGRAKLGKCGGGDGEFSSPTALALLPGVGLLVREALNEGRLQVFR
jgi:hypothetical protein